LVLDLSGGLGESADDLGVQRHFTACLPAMSQDAAAGNFARPGQEALVVVELADGLGDRNGDVLKDGFGVVVVANAGKDIPVQRRAVLHEESGDLSLTEGAVSHA